MGLLQKKPQLSSISNIYRVGTTKNLLIIGLGNPGKEYVGTRHNIGYATVDHLATKLDFPKWSQKKDLRAHITLSDVADSRVILAKPDTYMNLSGQAAIAIASFYKIPDTQIIVVYDDLDVAFGQIRTRIGGSSAGHNGVKSLIDHLGENFGRVRIGIGQPVKGESKDYVLGGFTATESKTLPLLLQESNSVISEYIYRGELVPETRSFII